jgi:hypothetical protein
MAMTEPVAGPSGPGTVVLDVGGEVGALVLFTPVGLDGREIEISRDGEPGARRTHSRVRARHMAAVTEYAAVYPGLRAGRYTIWADQDRPAAAAVITGGQVTTSRWPGSEAQPQR